MMDSSKPMVENTGTPIALGPRMTPMLKACAVKGHRWVRHDGANGWFCARCWGVTKTNPIATPLDGATPSQEGAP
jgi:hypothetical protein